MKCSICGEEVKVTFLNKICGTYIKRQGKLKVLCPRCQREENEKVKRNKK